MKRQPRTFYTSDLHLGHESVAVRHRGFESVASHDARIFERWGAVVQPGDTVYVLGDVIGRHDHAAYALDVLAALPGTKHLVTGNHDPVHPMHRRTFAKALPAFLEVFETVSPFLRRKIGGYEVLLSHFPYAGYGEGPYRGGAEASRYDQYRLPDMGVPIIHGHTHQPERYHVSSKPYRLSLGVHVGVDAWGLAPAPQEDVIAILDKWRG